MDGRAHDPSKDAPLSTVVDAVWRVTMFEKVRVAETAPSAQCHASGANLSNATAQERASNGLRYTTGTANAAAPSGVGRGPRPHRSAK